MSEQNQWQLLKFGGTSVSTAKNWINITTIIKQKLADKKRLLIVHSALSGVSNRLEQLIEFALMKQSDSYQRALNELLELHLQLIEELRLDKELLDEHFRFLNRLVDGIHLLQEASDKVIALIMAQGELWATIIGQNYLQLVFQGDKEVTPKWFDARDYLKALANQETNYLAADCCFEKDHQLQQLLKTGSLFVTQGFIASNSEQETILLGRGGSDTSAAYFAAKIAAKELEIWTDVAGIFTANPNQVQNARLLKNLNYHEAQEMASAGAKVLHPRAIRPVKKADIPIYIRSTIEPQAAGTKIHHFANKWGIVKAITAKHGLQLISMQSDGMWQQSGFLADLFAIFKRHQVSIDLVSTSETNVTVSLDNITRVVSKKRLNDLTQELSTLCKVELLEDCSAVSIVGQDVRAILHKIAPALAIFETYKVYLLSQAASDLNLTFVIDDEYSSKVISLLHELLISNNPNSEILGPTITELKAKPRPLEKEKWWQKKRQQLIELMSDKDNAYVYNLPSLVHNIEDLKSISAVSKIFFAVKANNNERVLQEAYKHGIGFETVSIYEVQKILKMFPNLDRHNVFFTPNFAQRSEYEQALAEGVLLSLDSSYPLKNWPEIFAHKSIFLRVDPSVGKGHHQHVRTAGASSKFGIPVYELDELLPILEKYQVKVIGLHAHAGSGILTNEHWAEHAQLLAKIAKKFPSVKCLNLGGGFGIKEKSQQKELVMKEINTSLLEFKESFPQYELWVEPGRYVVANSGVLISKVTQVKQKENYYYVGLNTGMNSLMRPALYGSYHGVYNLTKLHEELTKLATVVGPICESTDKLAIEIPFPNTEEGDIVLIENTGAYGFVMANNYNMRKAAKEHCI